MKKSGKKAIKTVLAIFSLFSLTACSEGLLITATDEGILLKTARPSPPRIQSFDYSPQKTTNADEIITFAVRANNRQGSGLQYQWKASRGTLLSNSGTTVGWKTTGADGKIDAGIATITVTVSDGGETVDASANVYIDPEGGINKSFRSVERISKRTEEPKLRDDIIDQRLPERIAARGQIIFQEDFSTAKIGNDWSVSGNNQYRSYLTWKIQAEEETRNRVAILTGPTAEVLSGTAHQEVLLTSTARDLRKTRQPRLSFRVKNEANPSTAVKINVYWESEGRRKVPLNVSFIPDKKWGTVDLDLQNLLDRDGGTVGYLSIGAKIAGNLNTFSGPMLDDLKIYEGE